jgi:hypothetical protein
VASSHDAVAARCRFHKRYVKEGYGEAVELIALGTNAVAAAQMLKEVLPDV